MVSINKKKKNNYIIQKIDIGLKEIKNYLLNRFLSI